MIFFFVLLCVLLWLNFFSFLRSFLFVFLAFFVVLVSCNAASEPSPEGLLQAARLRPTTHPITLSAEIRGAEQPLPLTFKIEKGAIEYQLHDPEELLILKLGPSTSSLSDTKKGASTLVSDEKRYQEIRNTGVTYDDLSLGFLYWPHPRIVGTETLRGMKASIIELRAPAQNQTRKTSQPTPYGSARIWIDEKNNAPLRMEGFDRQGHLLKRFEVISAQKVEGLWMLKEMRIETFDPTTQKVIQRRYLDLAAAR